MSRRFANLAAYRRAYPWLDVYWEWLPISDDHKRRSRFYFAADKRNPSDGAEECCDLADLDIYCKFRAELSDSQDLEKES